MFIQRNRWRLDRRTFLRGAGVSLALPWLEAMGIRSGSVTNAGEIAQSEIPRRAYFSAWGFFNNRTIPKETGKNYTLTTPFDVLNDLKSDFTLFSGMRVAAGAHPGPGALLTGKNSPRNNIRLVSVDQQIAAHYQGKTRVPSLVLGITRATGYGGDAWVTPSFTANRTPIAPENRPDVLFDRLFRVQNVKARKAQLTRQHSILDLVKLQAHDLEKKLGKEDRATIDQYFTSIRDIEERITIDRNWLDTPPPRVQPIEFGKKSGEMLVQAAQRNDDGAGMERYLRVMFDVIALALHTDCTRVVAHYPKGEGGPTFKDATRCPYDYHTLTHHSEEDHKLRWWTMVDRIYMKEWAYFLGKLKSLKEGQGTLLDHTMAVWATTNGEGGHGLTDLPLMLAGGAGLGVKHQGHLVRKNLWVGSIWETMLDRIGMPLPANFQAGLHDGVVKELL